MKPLLSYINLSHRTERDDLMKKNWGDISELNRFEAINMSATKEGVKGCFLSHKGVIETIIERSVFRPTETEIIAEDDIVPCSDFNKRLKLLSKELPADWDIYMLGYSVNPMFGKFSKVSKHICKAENFVLAGHCYVIHPRFFQTIQEILDNPKIHEYNFDAVLQYIQTHHNMYMAMPALCYQYSSYSDNSYMVVGNTELTKKYFKDVL